MIASRRCSHPNSSVPHWHAPFLEMLPIIRRHARIAFRHLPDESRREIGQTKEKHRQAAYPQGESQAPQGKGTRSSAQKTGCPQEKIIEKKK